MSRTYKDTRKGKEKIAETYGGWWRCVGGISSTWKRMRKRKRKAKEKEALRIGKEIPIFKNDDEWDWW